MFSFKRFFKTKDNDFSQITELRAEIDRLFELVKVKELEAERVDLKKEVSSTREALERLKLKRKIEEEDIKHLVKLAMEKNEVELERKMVEINKQKQDEIAKVKDDYRDKMEGNLQKQIEDTKEMYAQILARLPNVNLELKKDLS